VADNSHVVDFFTLFGPHPTHGTVTAPGAERLRAVLTKHGVPSAVTLSTRTVYFDAVEGNRETQAEGIAARGMLIPAALLDPRRPNPERTGGGARVLALLPALQGYPLPYAPLTALLTMLGQLGGAAAATIPVFVEASRPGDATSILHTVLRTKYPAAFVLGGVSAENLMETVSVVRALPDQLHMATNGLRGIGEVALAAKMVGAARVVFASGAPALSLGAALALVRQADLSAEDLELVLGGNARRLLSARTGA
jgi:hypothetical protein